MRVLAESVLGMPSAAPAVSSSTGSGSLLPSGSAGSESLVPSGSLGSSSGKIRLAATLKSRLFKSSCRTQSFMDQRSLVAQASWGGSTVGSIASGAKWAALDMACQISSAGNILCVPSSPGNDVRNASNTSQDILCVPSSSDINASLKIFSFDSARRVPPQRLGADSANLASVVPGSVLSEPRT